MLRADIWRSGGALTAADLVAGYRSLIGKAHAKGIRVIGATLTPGWGSKYLRREMAKVRQETNEEDTAHTEQTIAFYVARIGHYLGDGVNPMHDSIHCEGWFGPNPHAYTRDHALHGRFESQFVDAIGLSASDVIGKIGAPAHQQGDIFEAVLAYLQGNADKVETIFQLDPRGAFADGSDEEARGFVYDRIAGGAAMLRDLLYRAWRESASHGQGAHRPQDPDAPGYNPATGTAPAPLDS
ncbi:hypothetical protein [Stakelama saccharophila]|uniref:S1/P1 Nuclease n=1 Tax=Stakelama saccharophila TaxID=3075605 RepID=A0ABZ0B6F4_9SPHN|nr:hypothetical protein [Stakelama sp. W311]WNO52985.1 hypothetical protein RPR59_11020 [Stakelama sp. W311]